MSREPHPSLFRRPRRCWAYARAVEEGGDRVLCCYCDFPMVLRTNAPAVPTEARAATLDHVVPGAGNGIGNVVAACFECNYTKGGRTPEEWALAGGPADAAERADRETRRWPSARALALVRELYGLPVPGDDAWSRPEPPADDPEFLW